MAHGGAVQQKETAAVRKLDAEADKAIAQLKLCEAKFNYMVYTGELANWLRKDMNVSEELFNARKQQRVCFACGKDHLLYVCPQYTPEIIDRVGKRRFNQGVTTGEGQERGQFREQRKRDKVQGLTNSGRNNQWKQSFHSDKAHSRKMDNGSETLKIRKVNLEQAKVRDVGSAAKSVVEETFSTDSESDAVSDAEMMMSDDSMDIIMQYKQAGPGNGQRDQHRG